MKKIFLYISFLFIATSTFAQVKVGSEGNIIATGNYPVAKSSDIKGGVHFFQTIADRNNLPANFRDTGMIAYVNENNTYYTLIGGIANSNWQTWNAGVTIQDGLISGGIVTSAQQGLKFYVSPAIYVIGGKFYSSPFDSVTLDPASAQSRVDVFIVDTTEHANKLTGVADGNLLTPQVNPSSQLALTQGIQINPGDTSPSSVITRVVYDENLGAPNEWIGGTEQAPVTIDFGDVTNPKNGSKDILLSKYRNTSIISFNTGAGYTITSDAVLSGWIYLRGVLRSSMYIILYNSITGAISNFNRIDGKGYGLNSNDSGSYQQFVIPLSTFSWTGNINGEFNTIEFGFYGTGDTLGTKGLHLDNIQLQKGINSVPPQSGTDLSAYHTATQLSDTSYSLNRPNNTKTVFLFESDTTGSGSGNGVQSVSGLNTDNTDPINPIVKISVDGTTITGDGTPASPLISHASGGGTSIDSTTASNGLTLVGKDVQLGGVLAKNTTIYSPSYNLKFNGTSDTTNNNISFSFGVSPGVFTSFKNNTSQGFASFYPSGNQLYSKTSLGKYAQIDTRSDGSNGSDSTFARMVATNATASSNIYIYPSYINTVTDSLFNFLILKNRTPITGIATVMRINRTNGGSAGYNGIGLSLDLVNNNSANTAKTTTKIISKLTNALSAAEVSQFQITGLNAGATDTLLTLNGDGSAKLNQYGSGTHTGTPTYSLQVDASGNIIEGAIGGGSYTLPTASSTVLGGVKVGTGLSIDGSGVLSATGGGGGTTYYANNGLTKVAGDTIQLGGTLNKNTTILTGTNTLTISGSIPPFGTYPLTLTNTSGGNAFNISASGFGNAINVNTTSGYALSAVSTTGITINAQSSSTNSTIIAINNGTGGTGISASSTSGSGGIFSSATGVPLKTQNSNTDFSSVLTSIDILRIPSPGTAANGMGTSIDISMPSAGNNTFVANRLISKLTDASDANYTSEFSIQGVLTRGTPTTLFTLSGNGSTRLNKYGLGTFTGTPSKQLSVTSTGVIIETIQPIITSQGGVPSSIPGKVGDINIDTTSKKLYIATGNTSSADWTITN